MAQWREMEIEQILEKHLEETRLRLHRRNQKPDMEYLAHSLAPILKAMMSDARRREVVRVEKWLDEDREELPAKIAERRRELELQSDAVWNLVEKIEKERK